MRTVKEVSERTGISVRTLHYYDEIGLLKPTTVSEAGYRFYDDKALEVLQHILFFREFDMPLKEIKSILNNPELDQKQLLTSQKQMLLRKKERLERIISSIDDILKGENKMDFEVFSKAEMEHMYQAMVGNMSDEQKNVFIGQYGSMEQFEKHFLESASSEQAQKNFAKVVEWYGDKDSSIAAETNPENSAIMDAYSKRLDAVMRKLAAKLGTDVATFEVRELVGEYDFVTKQLYQMKEVSALSLEIAKQYQTDQIMQEQLDKIYGVGTTKYIGEAIEKFYKS